VAMQKVETYGGKFSLIGFQPTVRSIFRMSRLDRVFRIFPDADAALTYQTSDNFTDASERRPLTVRSTV